MKKTDDTITDYYLHILTKTLAKRDMNIYIKNFIYQRNKSKINENCFTCINRSSIKEIMPHEDFDDKDYYIDFLVCIFCKEEFNSFVSLFYHTTIMHEKYKCFLSTQPWPDVSEIQEAHIIVYPSQSYGKNFSLTNDDKNFHFVREEEKFKRLLIQNLKKADLNDHNDDRSEDEIYQNSKNNLANANNVSHSKNYHKTYKAKDPEERIFFHSVTGEILNENSEDSDYEVDNDDILEFEAREIVSYTDICDKDKEFFKLWNRYINTNRLE